MSSLINFIILVFKIKQFFVLFCFVLFCFFGIYLFTLSAALQRHIKKLNVSIQIFKLKMINRKVEIGLSLYF